MRRPTCETILSMMRSRCALSTNDDVRALEPAFALDEDLVVAVDHHFGDRVVAEELFERPVPEHVVGDLALDAPPLLASQRRAVERELLGDRVQHPLGEIPRALALEELRTELRDHRVMDAASSARRTGRLRRS